MNKLYKDLATITSFSQASIEDLFQKSNLCIAHKVLETYLERSGLSEIDIGIGTLYIKYDGVSQLSYKFCPSMNLDKEIFTALNSNHSPLIDRLEDKIKDRIETTYKNLL